MMAAFEVSPKMLVAIYVVAVLFSLTVTTFANVAVGFRLTETILIVGVLPIAFVVILWVGSRLFAWARK